MSAAIVEKVNETVDFLKSEYDLQPQVGVILGSGLGNFVQKIKIEKEVPYEQIPHFPVSTVKGHSGRLIFGEVAGKKDRGSKWPVSLLRRIYSAGCGFSCTGFKIAGN